MPFRVLEPKLPLFEAYAMFCSFFQLDGARTIARLRVHLCPNYAHCQQILLICSFWGMGARK